MLDHYVAGWGIWLRRYSGHFEGLGMQGHGGMSRRICDFMATARAFLGQFAAVAAVGFFAGAGFAQTITPEQLQQLQQGRASGSQQTQPAVTPRETIIESATESRPLPESRLERLLSQRADRPLTQFGYDQLGSGRSISLPQVGAVQDDYVLGPGDEVVLTLRGQENNEYRATVDRDGNVTFPRLNPVAGAGRSFGQFRQEISGAIQRAYVSTQGFVTVGRIRQITVLVSGEVRSPGVRTLTGLSTPADAILVSGGVKKTGSLRAVTIIRGGRTINVDLYAILTGRASSKQVALANGDRIVVPTIGATVAVSGNVRRPGIYELPAGQSAISVGSAVALASGMEVPGSYTVSVLRTMPDGKRQFVDVTGANSTPVRDGEIISVRTAVNVSLNQVSLEGAVRTPGRFAIGRYKTLHDLLPNVDVFQPGAYLLIGIIDRTNPKTLQRSAVPFSPLQVVQGKENLDLLSDDVVRILTKSGMRALVNAMIEENRKRDASPFSKSNGPQRNGLDDTHAPENKQQPSVLTNAQNPSGEPGSTATGVATATLLGTLGSQQGGGLGLPSGTATTAVAGGGGGSSAATAPSVASPPNSAEVANVLSNDDTGGFKAADQAFFGKALFDYRVTLSGAVQDPGIYLVAAGTSVADAVAAAGGLTNDADLGRFELTSTVINNETGVSKTLRSHFPATAEQLASLILRPYDDVNFRTVFSDVQGATVTLRGEVRYPGTYNILRGERLSSVLERAGGLTESAYPYGTVFLRESAARRERELHERQAREIQNQLMVGLTRRGSDSKLTPETFTALQSYVSEIRNQQALGRISVTADPAVLAANPGSDPMLEADDKVFIPARPYSIAVMGEVLQPGSVAFRSDMSPEDYVAAAGGYTRFADEDLTIVVYPDGSARRATKSWFRYSSEVVPPGSTIFVARDISGVDAHQMMIDLTQIVSQMAVSLASVAVLAAQL